MTTNTPDSQRRPLLRRDPHNPLLTTADLPHTTSGIYNPGAVLCDGETLLLARVEERSGVSHLTTARSTDGISDWRIDHVAFAPDPEHPEEAHGIEDPRITQLEDGVYAIAYTAYSERGPLVSLATTSDFQSFERIGPVMPPENKDAALFPVRFDGRWAMLHRPVTGIPEERGDIWISFSPDLRHWGSHQRVLPARRGVQWDARRIGVAAPPLLTDDGWLLLYHAVRRSGAGTFYYLGLALLDTADPTRVIRRSSEWILGPDAEYEQSGGGGIVFPCGWIRDGDALRIYYGAADRVVALAHARVSQLLRWLARHAAGSIDGPGLAG
jgi:predicted GH43/DUF377 family glycosyl hydrolase